MDMGLSVVLCWMRSEAPVMSVWTGNDGWLVAWDWYECVLARMYESADSLFHAAA